MRKKYIFAVMITACLLSFMLISCQPETAAPDETTIGISEDIILLTPVSEGKSEYKIVIPRSAGVNEKKAADILRDAISRISGAELEIIDDYVNQKRGIVAGELEILIGETARDESRELMRYLRVGDSTVRAVGKKLVILGGSQELTLSAAERLVAGLTADEAKNVYINSSHCSEQTGEYEISSFLLEGTDVREYRIIYQAGNSDTEKLASEIRQHFLDAAGIKMSVSDDSREAAGREIVIGDTDRDTDEVRKARELLKSGESTVLTSDNSIFIVSSDIFSLKYAVKQLLNNDLSYSSAQNGVINALLSGKKISDSSPVRSVMSFNILCTISEKDRPEKVISTVRSRMPDSVGFQEVTETWLKLLENGLGDEYDWVGEVNDPDSQKWRNAIFYRRSKLELISTETRWLSATSNRKSKFELSSQYRICTVAYFRCRDSGQQYCHVNTHLDYLDGSQRPQVNVLLNQLSKIDVPFVLTGDFNFTPSSEFYEQLLSGGVSDSKFETSDRDDKNTCSTNIIDYCCISPGEINVRCYRVEDKVICSDHRAVYVEFSLYK